MQAGRRSRNEREEKEQRRTGICLAVTLFSIAAGGCMKGNGAGLRCRAVAGVGHLGLSNDGWAHILWLDLEAASQR